MSGGSFEYLCYNVDDASEVFRHTYQVKRMVEHLENIGKHDAAREVMKYNLFLSAMRSRIETYGNWIQPLLKATEWEASGDSGMEAIDRAYDELLGSRFAPSENQEE